MENSTNEEATENEIYGTCVLYRCNMYEKDTVSPIGVMNCTATAWVCNCKLSCPFRNYAISLNPSLEDPNGSYDN